MGFGTMHRSLDINVYCLTREVYRSVSALSFDSPSLQEPRRPRVFISYTGNDQNNAAWTRRLAEQLRANGVDAQLDVYPS